MSDTTKTWPCPQCGGSGYEDWEEDGRMVTDPCYHCGTTGKVDYDPNDRSTWSVEMLAEVEREENRPRYPCSHGDPCLCWDVPQPPTEEEIAELLAEDAAWLASLPQARRDEILAEREESDRRRQEREAYERAYKFRMVDCNMLSDEMGGFPKAKHEHDDFDDPFAGE